MIPFICKSPSVVCGNIRIKRYSWLFCVCVPFERIYVFKKYDMVNMNGQKKRHEVIIVDVSTFVHSKRHVGSFVDLICDKNNPVIYICCGWLCLSWKFLYIVGKYYRIKDILSWNFVMTIWSRSFVWLDLHKIWILLL